MDEHIYKSHNKTLLLYHLKDHVHFLVQSVPTLSITQIVTKIKGKLRLDCKIQ
jgi:REP element-mobilizing transposase RayT